MPSEKVNESTKCEWRELGFYYDYDEHAKRWRLVGSKAGLLRFSEVLRSYIANPRNRQLSEHEHYGPYMYFEVGTWSEAQITEHWIAGTIEQLSGLAQKIEDSLSTASVGDLIEIGQWFSPKKPGGVGMRSPRR